MDISADDALKQGYSLNVVNYRLRMLANGWSPIRLHTEEKRPVDKGWPGLDITEELIKSWGPHPRATRPRGFNTGIRCDGGLIGVDIDTNTFDMRDAVVKLVAHRLGPTTWYRIGNPRRVMMLYRTELSAPYIRKTSMWVDPDYDDTAHRVEVKQTRAGQIAAYGIHSPGKMYEWPTSSPLNGRPEDVIQVASEDVVALINELEEWFPGAMKCKRAQGTTGPRDRQIVYDLEPDMEFETSDGPMTAAFMQRYLRRLPTAARERYRLEVFMDPVRATEHNRMTGLAALTKSRQLIITDWSEDRKHLWKDAQPELDEDDTSMALLASKIKGVLS